MKTQQGNLQVQHRIEEALTSTNFRQRRVFRFTYPADYPKCCKTRLARRR